MATAIARHSETVNSYFVAADFWVWTNLTFIQSFLNFELDMVCWSYVVQFQVVWVNVERERVGCLLSEVERIEIVRVR